MKNRNRVGMPSGAPKFTACARRTKITRGFSSPSRYACGIDTEWPIAVGADCSRRSSPCSIVSASSAGIHCRWTDTLIASWKIDRRSCARTSRMTCAFSRDFLSKSMTWPAKSVLKKETRRMECVNRKNYAHFLQSFLSAARGRKTARNE